MCVSVARVLALCGKVMEQLLLPGLSDPAQLLPNLCLVPGGPRLLRLPDFHREEDSLLRDSSGWVFWG